jgi:hypothetical protein
MICEGTGWWGIGAAGMTLKSCLRKQMSAKSDTDVVTTHVMFQSWIV